MEQRSAHILVFPYPAQGHIIPLLDLTHHLATRALTITVLVTPNNLSLLTPLVSRHPSSIKPLILPFPNYPSLPPGIENHTNLPSGTTNQFLHMINAMSMLHDPLHEWWTNQDSPPVAILSDMFLGWTHDLAMSLGVPRIVFSPSGSMALSVIYSLWRHLPENPGDENSTVSFSRIPNSPKYPWWQVSPLYRAYMAGDPVAESLRKGFLGDLASWGLVVNSFMELEQVYFDYLKNDLGHDRLWAVGPLHLSKDGMSRRGLIDESATEVLKWLDTCEDHSVVYVCFGSQAVLKNNQMDALALGLEKSQVNFIWCTKEHVAGDYGVVPAGFEDRTAGRGHVVKGWAKQVTILNHKAVGVFLTHCGWNSMLESISAGVPMLTWPMSADQFVNATLMVEQLGVAVRVCDGARTVPDSDELARLFSESLDESRVERFKAADLREEASKSIKKGGSSYDDLDNLVMSLSKLGL